MIKIVIIIIIIIIKIIIIIVIIILILIVLTIIIMIMIFITIIHNIQRNKNTITLPLEFFTPDNLYITIEDYAHQTVFVIKAHNKMTFWKSQRNLSMEIF